MLLGSFRRRLTTIVAGMRRAVAAHLWARPPAVVHATGTGADLLRSRAQLLAKNALLRQQLIVLRRGVTRPVVTRTDRALLNQSADETHMVPRVEHVLLT